MKKIFLTVLAILSYSSNAFANPCVVCTVAIGASLSIARKLGVNDCAVGVWGGAMLAMIGYWTISFLEKRKWIFKGYKELTMLISVAMIGFMYVNQLAYQPMIIGFLYIDSFLLSSILGAIALIFSMNLYAWMKAKNGGRAHFPFEKVFIPVVIVFALSLLLNYCPF